MSGDVILVERLQEGNNFISNRWNVFEIKRCDSVVFGTHLGVQRYLFVNIHVYIYTEIERETDTQTHIESATRMKNMPLPSRYMI